MVHDRESELPEYASQLAAYHEAFAPELRAMVASLPIREGDRVLDMACGDGTYSRWLAERVGPSGSVVALDASPAFLEVARKNAVGGEAAERSLLVTAMLEGLPFADGTFDLAWCAQSLYSLPEPVEALRRMRRVVRPGGAVAVLENDTLHQVLLPWPVEIELAVRQAELRSFVEGSDEPRKYYVGRWLSRAFREAGLEGCRGRTWASDREAPLGKPERFFLREYLRDLRGRVAPHLTDETLAKLDRLLDEGSGSAMLDSPDLTMTVIDRVVWGVTVRKDEG
jgi:SAM-dependent methyltransferase